MRKGEKEMKGFQRKYNNKN